MAKTSIVFFGSGPVATASLDLLKNNFEIEAVVTKPSTLDKMAGFLPGIEFKSVNNKSELDSLVNTKPFTSQLAILIDFGIIVSESVINFFPLGIINSHFSLLPEWRGADPISFAILSGQSKTGVSLMLLDKGMDTGKILATKSLPIDQQETTSSLTAKLIDLSDGLLLDTVPGYISGKIKPRSQPHPERATYSRKLTKEDGIIDWTKPASVIEREIRAFIEWPKSVATIAAKEVIITKAHVIDQTGEPGVVEVHGKELVVFCGEAALAIDRLKPAGKKEMTSEAFLAGHRHLI